MVFEYMRLIGTKQCRDMCLSVTSAASGVCLYTVHVHIHVHSDILAFITPLSSVHTFEFLFFASRHRSALIRGAVVILGCFSCAGGHD